MHREEWASPKNMLEQTEAIASPGVAYTDMMPSGRHKGVVRCLAIQIDNPTMTAVRQSASVSGGVQLVIRKRVRKTISV